MTLVAANAMMTGARAELGIYFFSIIRPTQTGIQKASKPAAVADLGSDPNSAQQSQISTQRYTELGSDTKVYRPQGTACATRPTRHRCLTAQQESSSHYQQDSC